MDTVYSNISSSTMLRVYGTRPKGFQSVLIPHILKMIAGAIPSSPILMVQPTGSGKSAVPATVAVVDGGVTIVIENTLALAADQCSKIVSNAMDTGLDCSDVHTVFRIGSSTSVINCIQEMGRCGRSMSSTGNDCFTISFVIKDYIYLYERLYVDDNHSINSTNVNNNIELEKYKKIQ